MFNYPKLTTSNKSGIFNYPSSTGQSANVPIGIKTQSPTDNIKPMNNVTPQPQKQNAGFNLGTLATQKALNTSNKNTPGYVPLKEDGILGPLTSGAISKYSTTSSGITPPSGGSEHNAFGSAVGSPTASTTSQTTTPASTPTPYTADTGLYGKLVTDLGNRSQQSSADYQAAQAEAKRIQDQQTQTAQDYAEKTKNIAGTAGFLTQQTGLQGLLANQYNTVQGALANQYAGATNRLGAANTQQQLQQSALGTAAGYAAPTGNIINVSPITGQPISGGSLQDLARTSGTIQGIQSGAATQAATGGNIASQQATQVAGYQSALQQGKNLQAQLTDLITTFGLNPNDINIANQGLQKIASNISDPHYKQLQNYVNDIANTYAQVLTPPGGSSTDTSRGIATSMLDATAKGTSLIDTMKSLDNAAQAKIAGVPTTGVTTAKSGPISWADL